MTTSRPVRTGGSPAVYGCGATVARAPLVGGGLAWSGEVAGLPAAHNLQGLCPGGRKVLLGAALGGAAGPHGAELLARKSQSQKQRLDASGFFQLAMHESLFWQTDNNS